MTALVSLAAGEAPPLIPTRDVDVTYELTGAAGQRDAAGTAGPALTERLRWNTPGHLLRIDPPGAGVYMITDYGAHRLSIVREADRTIVEATAPAAALPGHAAGQSGAPYQRQGVRSVAGLDCTDWATVDTEQQPVVICVTDDGVLLSARRRDRPVLAARSVTYGPLPAALFRLPADYRRTGAIAPGGAP